jgi:hypothetical protein
MDIRKRYLWLAPILIAIIMAVGYLQSSDSLGAQAKITTPHEHLGFNLGDDYHLANFTQLSTYWKKLEQQSNRLTLAEYGKSSEGRPMLMAIITAPENHKQLARYKEISRRLALAEGLTDEQARALAAEGKAVVWIDAGLHGTEVANAQALSEFVYEMVSRNDEETQRILRDVIFLAAFANPDGLELVANWYMREPEPTKRSTANLPVLYQKYIGHDNNRESLLANMPEAASYASVLYNEWYPQIMWNQHQTGPAGAVLFFGHMRDPNNPYIHPLIAPSTELISAAIHSRYVAEGKPGSTSRSMASYQNWWNGGIRSTTIFHNQIGILSEISGNPTPMDIAFLPRHLVASNDNPYPVQPQRWHFRQTIEYLLSAERAILDIAARRKDEFLFNIYRMGKDSIERGSTDSWTTTANRVAVVEAAMEKDGAKAVGRSGFPVKYYEMLRTPELRDPRGFIIPADQRDFLTATKFVNALIKNGVTVHRATASFTVGQKNYPVGSYVVKSAQAFRPHVLDNFEPQDYPNDFEYPGGPPIRPYDVTGYTLAFQMGVQFDRILDGFDGPFERIQGMIGPPAGKITGNGTAGFLLSPEPNDTVIAINRLLASGEDVYRLQQPVRGSANNYPAGAIFVRSGASTAGAVQKLANEVGLNFEAIAVPPGGDALRLRATRIGVVDVYGGSMPSGWVQWLLGQYGYSHEVLYPPDLDAGNLSAKYDALILENGIVPAAAAGFEREREALDPATVPAEYHSRIGSITADKTIPQLSRFLSDGGTILAIGSSTALASQLRLPISNALVEPNTTTPLRGEKFYVPGALLRLRVDNAHPLAYGLPEHVDVVFNNNPSFKLSASDSVRRVAWFDTDKPLRSGWAWGQQYLNGTAGVAEATVGKGRLLMFGPLVVFRAHPHGTFKFLFNGIHYGNAQRVRLPGESTTER